MKISVTQEDIDNGFRFASCDCPVARALKRSTGRHVVAGLSRLVGDYGKAFYLETPAAVKRFMIDFDHQQPVEPFEFEILYPES